MQAHGIHFYNFRGWLPPNTYQQIIDNSEQINDILSKFDDD